MEIFIFLTIIGALIANTLIVRYYVKEAVMKLSGQTQLKTSSFPLINGKGAPNEIVKEDIKSIEFSEENPMDIPKNVKFDIEGGDSVVPPGYEESSQTN